MAKVLIVDDEESTCKLFSTVFVRKGHEALAVHNIADAFTQGELWQPDLILLDVVLPDGNGLDSIQGLRAIASAPEIIMLTGFADVDAAELAIRRGAWSYIVKSVKLQYIVEAVQGALQCRGEKSVALPREILRTEGIVGNSREIRVCMELMSKATLTDTSVLILGETGTGKELFARAIHSNSRRRQKNFVVVDCAALPENLVESVLFGYARGAFTGADMPRDGLVKQADGGTLFLDEIGEMPPALQKPFLRVLQEKVFRPVGGDKEIHSDFRLVTATNRDLDVLVAEGRFREDLLFRLRSVTLNLPPLRDRIADIQELIIYHLRRICEQYGWPLKAIAPEFVEFLSQYTWPGNVRELVHALESALIAAEGQGTLFPQHLPDGIRIQVIRRNTSAHIPEQPASLSEHSGANVPTAGIGSLKEIREAAADAAEKQYLLELIAATRNNVNEACQLSDLSRSRFYTLLRKHHISTRE